MGFGDRKCACRKPGGRGWKCTGGGQRKRVESSNVPPRVENGREFIARRSGAGDVNQESNRGRKSNEGWLEACRGVAYYTFLLFIGPINTGSDGSYELPHDLWGSRISVIYHGIFHRHVNLDTLTLWRIPRRIFGGWNRESISGRASPWIRSVKRSYSTYFVSNTRGRKLDDHGLYPPRRFGTR